MKWNFENTENLVLVTCYKDHWVMATNFDTYAGHDLTLNREKNKPIFVYDSLNQDIYVNALEKVFEAMYPSQFGLKNYCT